GESPPFSESTTVAATMDGDEDFDTHFSGTPWQDIIVCMRRRRQDPRCSAQAERVVPIETWRSSVQQGCRHVDTLVQSGSSREHGPRGSQAWIKKCTLIRLRS